MLCGIFSIHEKNRDAAEVFGVNSIDFHLQNTFASVGSDGVISFWDKDARYDLDV